MISTAAALSAFPRPADKPDGLRAPGASLFRTRRIEVNSIYRFRGSGWKLGEIFHEGRVQALVVGILYVSFFVQAVWNWSLSLAISTTTILTLPCFALMQKLSDGHLLPYSWTEQYGVPFLEGETAIVTDGHSESGIKLVEVLLRWNPKKLILGVNTQEELEHTKLRINRFPFRNPKTQITLVDKRGIFEEVKSLHSASGSGSGSVRLLIDNDVDGSVGLQLVEEFSDLMDERARLVLACPTEWNMQTPDDLLELGAEGWRNYFDRTDACVGSVTAEAATVAAAAETAAFVRQVRLRHLSKKHANLFVAKLPLWDSQQPTLPTLPTQAAESWVNLITAPVRKFLFSIQPAASANLLFCASYPHLTQHSCRVWADCQPVWWPRAVEVGALAYSRYLDNAAADLAHGATHGATQEATQEAATQEATQSIAQGVAQDQAEDASALAGSETDTQSR